MRPRTRPSPRLSPARSVPIPRRRGTRAPAISPTRPVSSVWTDNTTTNELRDQIGTVPRPLKIKHPRGVHVAARGHDDAHRGMFEAAAVQRVAEFDVDTQIVGIELEPIARRKLTLLGDVQGQCGDRAVTGRSANGGSAKGSVSKVIMRPSVYSRAIPCRCGL